MLISMACRYEQFLTDWYVKWCTALGYQAEVSPQVVVSYRKIWEFAAIIQALQERDMLAPGRKGLGFAVGQEPLSSFFANRGVEILATDLPDDIEGHWTQTGEHAASLNALLHDGLVSAEDFRRLVRFTPVNMNDLAALPNGEYDFLWSSCAMEHIGNLEKGTEFVKNSMRLLKPGGVAVHTTEFNCSSNDATVEEGWNVIYRRRDIERLANELRLMRCGMETLDFGIGTHAYDIDYDEPPYFTRSIPHIKLLIDGHVSTSFLMVIQKGPALR